MNNLLRHSRLFFASLLSMTVIMASLIASPVKPKPKYPVSAIPHELLEGADQIVRHDHSIFEILGKNKVIAKHHMAVTILNQQAEDVAFIKVFFDQKLNRISGMKATVYDKFGEEVKSISQKKFNTNAIGGGGNIATTIRVLNADLRQAKYPYTVEYSYTEESSFSFGKDWYVQNGPRIAVEYAKLEVYAFEDEAVEIIPREIEEQPTQVTSKQGLEGKQWEFEHLSAFTSEVMAPNLRYALPRFHIVPQTIYADGIEGSMASWESFGRFYHDLNAGRQELPEAFRTKVHKMTAEVDDPMEKAQILYRYMQDNTRYVSIQLGIGGFQTFPAESVAKNGYGDCKALTNFMHAMLKELEIPSYPTLIGAGVKASPVDPSFTYDPFNHAILCVPNGQDTVWLECTSSTAPFGYLGNFTDNRYALVCTPDGGILQLTQETQSADNIQYQTFEGELDELGNIEAIVITEATGWQQDRMRYLHKSASPTEQREYLEKRRWNFSGLELKQFSFEDLTDESNPRYRMNTQMAVRKWAKKSGNRLFVPLNRINAFSSVPRQVEDRAQEFVRYRAYIDVDSTWIQLPEDYSIESLDESPVKIQTEFGSYESQATQIAEDRVLFVRRIRMEKGIWEPEKYAEYREFVRTIVKADKSKMVLNKAS
ncbi:DUF3857 domain-containing protein [Pontibacter sp. G13]|uniref:DUF3857 domain-containing protein n=1 Tax=Pontibacter sp. G13 TaxID=3074898 RepID=UPI002889A1F1|nr:DUF3857 domain-containing protein [Pontibacter sp. G13]WNJ16096.1 DUF3857 domain-containing protein [Pontibacter sp. G13]